MTLWKGDTHSYCYVCCFSAGSMTLWNGGRAHFVYFRWFNDLLERHTRGHRRTQTDKYIQSHAQIPCSVRRAERALAILDAEMRFYNAVEDFVGRYARCAHSAIAQNISCATKFHLDTGRDLRQRQLLGDWVWVARVHCAEATLAAIDAHVSLHDVVENIGRKACCADTAHAVAIAGSTWDRIQFSCFAVSTSCALSAFAEDIVGALKVHFNGRTVGVVLGAC